MGNHDVLLYYNTDIPQFSIRIVGEVMDINDDNVYIKITCPQKERFATVDGGGIDLNTHKYLDGNIDINSNNVYSFWIEKDYIFYAGDYNASNSHIFNSRTS